MGIRIGIGSLKIGQGSTGVDWSSYWTKLLSDISYSHPMLPGLYIEPDGTNYKIASHTINDFRKTLANPVIKYIDAVNGLDTNNGNTPETAYKSLTTLHLTTWDRAYFLTAGCYATTSSALLNSDRELISSVEGVYVLRGALGTDYTWTDVGGGVFTTPLTASPVSIIDTRNLTAEGDPIRLTPVASAAAVAATANTWFRDSGANVLYVRLYDDVSPLLNAIALPSAVTTVQPTKHVYLENINILGGLTASGTSATRTKINAKGCKFMHRYDGNAFACGGSVDSWFEDCVAARASQDGFNYKNSTTWIAYGVEVNCVGRNCGGIVNGAASNLSNSNGSTIHDDCMILRVNGDYHDCEGPSVHESNHAVSLNVNVQAYDSICAVAGNKSAFAIASEVGEDCKMYLWRCTSSGADTVGAENRAPLTAHIYAHEGSIHSVEAGTTLEDF